MKKNSQDNIMPGISPDSRPEDTDDEPAAEACEGPTAEAGSEDQLDKEEKAADEKRTDQVAARAVEATATSEIGEAGTGIGWSTRTAVASAGHGAGTGDGTGTEDPPSVPWVAAAV